MLNHLKGRKSLFEHREESKIAEKQKEINDLNTMIQDTYIKYNVSPNTNIISEM